jgi:cyclin B
MSKSMKVALDENTRGGGRAYTGVVTRRRAALGDVTNTARREAGASSEDVICGVRASASSVPAVLDIDAADRANPLCFTDYVGDIFAKLREREAKFAASCSYMHHQTDINEKMRAILIDWLVEVHLKFKLMPETLYLTINLIDRFLERKLVIRQKLQLVGVTAMLLASKYEEIYAPEVKDFVYITDRAYTRAQILSMEAAMLNALKFNLTVPTAYPFLNRFLKAAQANRRVTNLAHYFVERTLQEYSMLRFLPSQVAAAAVNMALRTANMPSWTATLEKYTGFTEESLRTCVLAIQGVLEAGAESTLQAVRKKYAHRDFGEVSSTPVRKME